MPQQPGTYKKYGRQARINPRTGREELMDGKWWVDAEALAPYGYDPDSAPPEVVEGNRIAIQRAAVEEAMAARGGGGGDLNGPWAQIARAAGLGHLVKPGWTELPVFKQLVQNLGYGHVKIGKNGQFIEERNGTYNVYDNNGNLTSTGQGAAAPDLFDAQAQANFASQAGGAIAQKGGSYAAQLAQAQNVPQPGVPVQVPGASVDPASVGGPTIQTQKPYEPAATNRPSTNRPPTTRPSTARTRPYTIAADTVGGPLGQATYQNKRNFGGLSV